MGEMDELLAQLKTEYAQPEQPSTSRGVQAEGAIASCGGAISDPRPEFEENPSGTGDSPLPPRSQEQSKPQITEPIDNLLAEVKAEFEREPTKLKQGRSHYTLNPKNSSSSKNTSNSDNMIEDLQQQDQAEDRAEQERKHQEIIAQKQKQQEKERRRTEALKQKAQEWFNNLDPKSDEGLWFEEFAYSYESKLEAAIDYLKAIRESHFLG